jgi:aminopeptidase N
VFILIGFSGLFAQNLAPLQIEQRQMVRIHHMDLEIEPNLETQELRGKAILTLSPFWKTINRLELNAEYMLIHKVYVNQQERSFNYDGKMLNIDLERAFGAQQEFNVEIDYTARPKRRAEVKPSENFGVYFTDTKFSDPDQATQVWTQGITQGSRLWFPTVDEPNQMFSHTLSIIHDQNLVSISNGILKDSKTHENGKLVDRWEMKQQHAPYLTFFALTDTKFNDLKGEARVSVYAQEATQLRLEEKANEILDFYEKRLQVDYPFEKLNVLVLEEFLLESYFGAGLVVLSKDLFNTTFSDSNAQVWEKELAAQIFKQWFGGLVSPESWKQISLSESLGGFGSLIWVENAYGKQAKTAALVEYSELYKAAPNKTSLLRERYELSDELLDETTSFKGPMVFNMLNYYLGDEGYYKGLKTYLETYKNQKTEIVQFRLAFEQSTGLDLNWFFDQWFLNTGIPQVQMDYDFNIQENTVTVSIKQMTDVYRFPLKLGKYERGEYDETMLWIDDRQKSFVFPYNSVPDLFEVNSDYNTLAFIQDDKTTQKLMFQALYSISPTYRLQALELLSDMQSNPDVFKVFESSIISEDAQIASFALQNLDLSNKTTKRNTIKNIVDLAQYSDQKTVRASAIELLGKLINPEYYGIFKAGLLEDSIEIQGASLTALYYLNQDEAFEFAQKLDDEAKVGIAYPLVSTYIKDKEVEEMDFVAQYLIDGMYLLNDKEIKETYEKGFDWVIKSDRPSSIKNLCNSIVEKSIQYKSYGFTDVGIDLLRRMISEQYKLNYDNRDEIISIVTGALDKLIQD